MQHIKGPDFPTGGVIMGRSGIRAAYATGRGKITLRGPHRDRGEAKTAGCGSWSPRSPTWSTRPGSIESIADLVKEKRVERHLRPAG